VRATLDETVASVSVNRNALRQILLGTLSHIIQSFAARSIEVGATVDQEGVDILVTIGNSGMAHEAQGPDGEDAAQRLVALRELAEAQGIQVSPLVQASRHVGRPAWGFRLRLPRKMTRAVLVVDDNDDILHLFKRYLTGHGYTMLAARDGAEAITLAKSCLPDAITLDLMMPEQDGWDVLVTLTNQPDTQRIPVIVCSVLGARTRSLSLGASLFLEKPVSEQALLAALAALGL
jgi:CheY-like chemotaxis protein